MSDDPLPDPEDPGPEVDDVPLGVPEEEDAPDSERPGHPEGDPTDG